MLTGHGEPLRSLSQYASQFPQRPAYYCREGLLTYGSLYARSRSLALHLLGLGAGGPVLVFGHKQPEMPVCMLACMLAGLPYIPVDSSTPSLRLADIARTARPGILLAVEQCVSLQDLPHYLSRKKIRAVSQEPAPLSYSFPPMPATAPCYIMFTSGSSGAPKGVSISYGNLSHFLTWMRSLPALAGQGQETILNHALFSFDLSVADWLFALSTGRAVWVLEKETQQNFPLLFQQLAQSCAVIGVMTPSFAEYCMLDPRFSVTLLPGLRVLFFCGEPLLPTTVHKLFQRFPGVRILNAYGPTEATVAVTAAEIGNPVDPGAPLPVGLVTGSFPIHILTKDGAALPQGAEGEIIITGPSVGLGYLNLESPAFFQYGGQPAYRTGDRGVIRRGRLYCLGRTDSQIKLGGYRVELADIEVNLAALPGVAACAVLYTGKQGRHKALYAYVQPQPSASLSPADLKRQLRSRLPAYMVPQRFILLESLPLTANGKCDKTVLKGLLQH